MKDSTFKARYYFWLIYERLGQFVKAKEILCEIAQLQRNVLGFKHPDTVLTTNKIIELVSSAKYQKQRKEFENTFNKLTMLTSEREVLDNEQPGTSGGFKHSCVVVNV